jgi:gluconolactonase
MKPVRGALMRADRRGLLKTGAAVAASSLAAPAFAEWAPSLRYPDPSVQSVDKRFDQYRIATNANVERLYSGCRWSEGPVWFGDQSLLIWADIPNNRMLKYDMTTEDVGVFRYPANNANGSTRDRQGRLVTCEHLTRRVTRTEYDGSITVLCDRFEGKRLNSPNDVVVKSDDSIWFTDPPFGIMGYYEGERAAPELPTNVYRIDGKSGKVSLVADDVQGPNGLCFSPDESKLYVVASMAAPNEILVYDVAGGTRLAKRRVFVNAGKGNPDGLRADVDGNLWCGWGTGSDELDGVSVFAPSGDLIGRVSLPERCANLCFGGPKRNRLFMAASHSLYALYVNTQGVGYS